MLVNTEHRSQIIYFLLSGITVSAILVLVYISLRITNDERYKDDLRRMQKTLILVKPPSTLEWRYNNTWKIIGNTSQQHGIYSAYFDARTDLIDNIVQEKSQTPFGSLRVFGIFPVNLLDLMTCILRFDDFSLKEIKADTAYPLREKSAKPFAAYTIMCALYNGHDNSSVRLPRDVAIAYTSNKLSYMSPTFVQISYPKRMDQIFSSSQPVISVCVAPIQRGYSNVLRVVEFVEMYRILGATHFYFYHLEINVEVVRVLNYYRSIGLADILDWNFHAIKDDYGGILAQYNDCVYRAMVVDNYRYAVIVDLDEVIVPFKHNSLKDFLRQCDEGRTSAFVFRNVFFYMKDTNDVFSVPAHIRNKMLYTQLKIHRTVDIQPAYSLSKYIVNTRSVIDIGDQIWRVLPSYADNVVHQTVGLLFHYRDKCLNCKTALMIDYTARKFGSLIWDRVDDTCLMVFMEINGTCPIF